MVLTKCGMPHSQNLLASIWQNDIVPSSRSLSSVMPVHLLDRPWLQFSSEFRECRLSNKLKALASDERSMVYHTFPQGSDPTVLSRRLTLPINQAVCAPRICLGMENIHPWYRHTARPTEITFETVPPIVRQSSWGLWVPPLLANLNLIQSSHCTLHYMISKCFVVSTALIVVN